MKILKLIFVIVVIISPFRLFSQVEIQPVSEQTIEGRLLDKKSHNPIAYAHIYDKSTGKGTISNPEGYFKLNVKGQSDIVLISIIGYKQTQLFLDNKHDFYQVYLEESLLLLKEVKIVAADNSYLYDLLNDCKKNQTIALDTSKVYYELKSYVDDKQVELVECFYNGTFSGYDLEELNLKYGRIALQTYNDQLFVSVETSRVISMLKLFDRNDYLPFNPLELTKRKLKKYYYLNLTNKYYIDNHDSIYIVEFTPKDSSRIFFRGQVWVNYSKKTILKIKLKCLNATEYPFLPLFPSDRIINVDMDITKSFQELNGKMLFKHIDFEYQITYRSRNNSVYNVKTNAILYSYDLDSIFRFPYFTFSDNNLSDYVKINAMPYNDFFWKNNQELKLNEQENKNELFYNDEKSITNKASNPLNQIIEKGLSEQPYTIWSANRISNRELTSFSSKTIASNPGIIAQDRLLYIEDQSFLNINLYLDINSLSDTLHYITASVFVPYKNYSGIPIDSRLLCYVNIYFDLVEIERRKLEKEIEKSIKNTVTIKKLYEESLARIEQLKKKYVYEAESGNNKNNITKWNNIVFQSLGINNIELFKPFEEKK